MFFSLDTIVCVNRLLTHLYRDTSLLKAAERSSAKTTPSAKVTLRGQKIWNPTRNPSRGSRLHPEVPFGLFTSLLLYYLYPLIRNSPLRFRCIPLIREARLLRLSKAFWSRLVMVFMFFTGKLHPWDMYGSFTCRFLCAFIFPVYVTSTWYRFFSFHLCLCVERVYLLVILDVSRSWVGSDSVSIMYIMYAAGDVCVRVCSICVSLSQSLSVCSVWGFVRMRKVS